MLQDFAAASPRVLKPRLATQDEKNESDSRLDAFVLKYGDASSYARVYKKLWIGDMGAALSIATGTNTKFAAVFNASGSEGS
jgi:hypothetical protein